MALGRRLGNGAVGLDHETLDITDRDAVRARLAEVRPAVVINTAAYTAVDRAESEPERCRAVNAEAVGHLAEACREHGALLVQCSTNYVFGADTPRRAPYREDDPPAPQGVYAQAKLEGEQRAAAAPRHLVVRTCGLYGALPVGAKTSNFVATMLRLGREREVVRVVSDQTCTPSYVDDVAAAIEFLCQSDAQGTFHVVNGGSTTWYDFAAEIFRLARLPARLERISTAEYGAAAPRPAFSVLDTSKYRALGGPPLADWHDALARHLAEVAR
jgi:dTDP-4-dehydrorhamnose reductase